MATRYGKTFRTRRGKLGRYKYVNGRRVAFVVNVSSHGTKYRVSKKRFWKRKYRGSHRR